VDKEEEEKEEIAR